MRGRRAARSLASASAPSRTSSSSSPDGSSSHDRRPPAPSPRARRGAAAPAGARPVADGGAADAAQRRAAAARRRDPGARPHRRRHRPASTSTSTCSSRPLVDIFTPGVLALAVMSTAFTSLAIATGFERRYGVIKRLGSSPLPRVRAARRQGRRAAPGRAAPGRRDRRASAQLLGWTPRARACSASRSRSCFGTAAFASLGLLVAGVAARRGHPRRGQPDLPAADGRRRASCCRLRRTATLGTFVQWLPVRGARRGDAQRAHRRRGRPGATSASCSSGPSLGTVLTARTFKWE